MTLIDLDVAPAPPAPRTVPHYSPRSIAVLVVALLTVVAVTGSGRVGEPSVRTLWSAPFTPDDTMTVTPGSLYVVHRDPGASTLNAYDLATGKARWSVPSADQVTQLPAVADGVIVMPSATGRTGDGGSTVLPPSTSTVSRDLATGRALWTASGSMAQVLATTVLLEDLDGRGDVRRLSMVGLRDGRVRWSRTGPLTNTAVIGDDVFLAEPDGTIEVVSADDGTPVRTGAVDWPDGGGYVYAIGDRLVVTGFGRPGTENSTVYRPDTLARVFSAPGLLTACGPVICGIDGNALIGYDPGTGARRWHLDGVVTSTVGVWTAAPDRIVAHADSDGAFQVLDPATGRRVGPPGNGSGTWPADGLQGLQAPPEASGTYVLGGIGYGREATVTRLDVRTGDRYLIGKVTGENRIGCRDVPGYLICPDVSRISVTAVG